MEQRILLQFLNNLLTKDDPISFSIKTILDFFKNFLIILSLRLSRTALIT